MHLNEEHPWQSGHDDFMTRVMPKLQEHGKAIGAAADAGDKMASEIVNRYTMLHRSFDPMTAMLIDQLLTKWLSTER